MNLAIDYGNSAAKVGIFDHQNLVEKRTLSSAENVQNFLDSFPSENVIISSVNFDPEKIASWSTKAKRQIILSHSLPLPIQNLYATPATLGVDRIAGVCGAQQIFPHQHCLVIDAGTCVTYDFLDNEGKFYGGGISPGLTMRFRAVHTFTAKLPLVSPTETPGLIGDSTETCIQSGVINGLLAELDGIINQYTQKFDGLRVILCGGDAVFFENKLKASIFASPELVLIGLNSILNYNVNR
jgi:type III pantothenate kinase